MQLFAWENNLFSWVDASFREICICGILEGALCCVLVLFDQREWEVGFRWGSGQRQETELDKGTLPFTLMKCEPWEQPSWTPGHHPETGRSGGCQAGWVKAEEQRHLNKCLTDFSLIRKRETALSWADVVFSLLLISPLFCPMCFYHCS